MSDVAVRAVNLGKIYRIGERQAYQTIRDVIANGARSGLRRASHPVRTRAGSVASSDDEWVCVLDDVCPGVADGCSKGRSRETRRAI